MTRFLLLLSLLVRILDAQTDWPVYGHDPGGQRHSPLTQITPSNVSKLERAWTYKGGKPGSQVTPVVIGGVMYVTTPESVAALEPETGKPIWRYDTPTVTRRGVAYWPGKRDLHPRVFVGSGSDLLALDATTGTPAPGFGNEGKVDMKKGVLDGLPDAPFRMMSPPVIFHDIVITGGNNTEGTPSTGAYGDIRGWDAVTGKLVWTFHTVPRPGEPGNDTWPKDGWKNRSGVNNWGFMTLDVERGMVFVPLGCPTSDFYGADRAGDGLYGNSLVALDAATGKVKWFRQLVHHDLWDYDVAAPPALIEATRNGRKVPAVAQITKMGMLFVFDRVTGEPIWGMEERPVPQRDVPGEKTSKTQPFPVKPAPLSRMDITRDELYKATPEHAQFCAALWAEQKLFSKGPFTPYPLGGPDQPNVLVYPSTLGGGNWSGVSYDPALGYAFTNINNLAQWGHMEKKVDPKTGEATYLRGAAFGGGYARFWNPANHIPCQDPPFGELVAVNMATGEIAWRSPLGTVPELEAKGVHNTGALNLGGSITTASGLVFIGAANDAKLRAFDSKTGKELWSGALDAVGQATPMTYLGKDGRQYVVIMGGGGPYWGSPAGDALVAFALPVGRMSN
jgi:quinoprotein glucose dehydrogenase